MADEPVHMHGTIQHSLEKLKARIAAKIKKVVAWAEKYGFDLSTMTAGGYITIDWNQASAALGQSQDDTHDAYIVRLHRPELAVAHAQGLLMDNPEVSDIDRISARIDRFWSLDTGFRHILDAKEAPLKIPNEDTIKAKLNAAGSDQPHTMERLVSNYRAFFAEYTGGRLVLLRERFAIFFDKVARNLKEVEDWGVKYGFDMDSLAADGGITLDWKTMRDAK